jgi:transcriptional regulator with XRE-family HTH domain
VSKKPRERTNEAFGAYVRSQRQLARLSLRQAAAMARISNPYLSQIEHGLALPSVTVIRGLADALQVSAETLLSLATGMSGVDAAGRSTGRPVDGRGGQSTEQAILHDPRLDPTQRHALLAVLATFLAASPPGGPPDEDDGSAPTAIHAPRPRQQPKASPRLREVHDHA